MRERVGSASSAYHVAKRPFFGGLDSPREMEKSPLPDYRVEPPDVLIIEEARNIRRRQEPLKAGDQLTVRVSNALPSDTQADPLDAEFKTIDGVYAIENNGTINLGPVYGVVQVAGLTVDQAQETIINHLESNVGLKTPKLWLTLQDPSGRQPISGEHLVRPDGTIALGVYGSLRVTGMTLDEVKLAVEEQLKQYLYDPEVRVDVASYNSKVVYVITDGGGNGEEVVPIPYTGNETVLDAISRIEGLSQISSKKIWVARPSPPNANTPQVMAVDWNGISRFGMTSTNYQLYPGDRVYIQADPWVTFDNGLAKLLGPVERVLGVTLLGASTVERVQGKNSGSNSNGGF